MNHRVNIFFISIFVFAAILSIGVANAQSNNAVNIQGSGLQTQVIEVDIPANTGSLNPGTRLDTGSSNPGTRLDTGSQNPRTRLDTGSLNPGGAKTQNKVFTLQNPLNKNLTSVGAILSKFIEIFSYIVVLFAVLALVWTGAQYIFSRGNTEKMKELTKQLGWILVGVAVVIGARIIITVIINTLSATGTVDPAITNSVNDALGR